MSKLNEQWVEEAKVEVKPAYEKLDPNSFYKNMVAFAEQWQEEKAAEEAAQATASPAPETGPRHRAQSPHRCHRERSAMSTGKNPADPAGFLIKKL